MEHVWDLSRDQKLAAFYDSGRIAVRGSSAFETNLEGLLVDVEQHIPFTQSLTHDGFIRPKEIIILSRDRIYVNVEKLIRPYHTTYIGVWDMRNSHWVWSQEMKGTDYFETNGLYSGNTISQSKFIDRQDWLVGTHLQSSARTIEVRSADKNGDIQLAVPGDSYRLHRDGDMIAILRKGEIALWSIKEKRPLRSFKGEDCSFAPSGKWLATWTSAKGDASVWDRETGKERCHFTSNSSIVFSPDGRRIISPRGAAIVIRDAETGTELIELAGPTSNLAFSPDGSSIIAVDHSRAKIWIADSPKGPRPG